jgi:D-aminopeptidase
LPTGDANALTDVPGVTDGHEPIVAGTPADPPCLRTGVTAIRPAERSLYDEPVTGATHVINAYGKAVGLPQVDELGAIETPICLTNTLDTWRVADALATHVADEHPDARSINPVVGECNDGRLNDIRGKHVTADHVEAALSATRSPSVREGCVGAGTGMVGFGWKGGIGTASRVVDGDDTGGYTVGALTLTNTGHPDDLRIDGVRIGRHLQPADARDGDENPTASVESDDGSILIVLGTDASLPGRQLGRVAKRGSLGLGRTGATASHGSGDFVVAFANGERGVGGIADADLSPLFRGAVEAVEEAIANSLVRAETTTGVDGTTYPGLPGEELASLFE